MKVTPTWGSSRNSGKGRSGIHCSYWRAGDCKYGSKCWNLHVDTISASSARDDDYDRDRDPPSSRAGSDAGDKGRDGFQRPAPLPKDPEPFAAPVPLAPRAQADRFAAPAPMVRRGFTERPAAPPAGRPAFTDSPGGQPSSMD